MVHDLHHRLGGQEVEGQVTAGHKFVRIAIRGTPEGSHVRLSQDGAASVRAACVQLFD